MLWRAAVVQGVSVAVLSVALALALPHSFFEDWGWLAGPGAWLACAALVGRVLALPLGSTLIGAALAGLWIAYNYPKRRRSFFAALISGILLPIILLQLGGGG